MARRMLDITKILFLAGVVALLPLRSFAKDGDIPNPSGEKITEHGRVDWEKGTLYATGLGIISNEEPNQAKAYLKARSFARLDALRNLLMLVDHVKIDSQTIGSDYEAKSDEIRAEVRGIVRGAEIIGERTIRKGNGTILEVTVSTALYGDQGIANAFLPEMIRRNRAALRKRPEDSTPDQPAALDPVVPQPPVHTFIPDPGPRSVFEPLTPPNPDEPVTSIIIDARGLKLERCMAPKIRRPDGSEVWGSVNVEPDYLIEHGITVYAHSLGDARRNERAGSNPLMVRAVGRAGGPFNSDPVLTDEDARRLLAANARYGFLNKFRVIFVLDSNQ